MTHPFVGGRSIDLLLAVVLAGGCRADEAVPTDPSGSSTGPGSSVGADTSSSSGGEPSTSVAEPEDDSGSGSGVPFECGDGDLEPTEVCFDSLGRVPMRESGRSPRLGDLDGDGQLDLVYLQDGGDVWLPLIIHEGLGEGRFGEERESTGRTFGDRMELGDFDLDGSLDVVSIATDRADIWLLLADGAGDFGEIVPGDLPGRAVEAAVGRDGRYDTIFTLSETSAYGTVVSHGTGQTVFTWDSFWDGELLPGRDIETGSFTGMGAGDLILAAGYQVWFVPNPGNDTFLYSERRQVPVDATDPRGLSAGDFDGDGILDIGIADERGAFVARGRPDGTFEGAFLLPESEEAPVDQTVAIDVTLDGRDDLVTISSTENRVRIHPSREGGRFSTPTDFALPGMADSIATGDLNEDEVPDIIVASYAAGQVTVLRSNP